MSRTPDPEAARAARLAAALRENLRRRKAQAKGRDAETGRGAQGGPDPQDTLGPESDPADESARGAGERAAVAVGTPAVDTASPEVAGEAGRVAGPSDKR